jgi:hydroxymethylglutaryl-CoA lyase
MNANATAPDRDGTAGTANPQVRICEVGPRDGLQNLAALVPTARKIDLIRRLADAGLKHIQIGAFVSPQAIPQFADIEAVAGGVRDLEDVTLSALVPNVRGARRAVACGIGTLVFFFSVSRAHNLANVRQTPEESLAALAAICAEVLPDSGAALRVDLATAFGCPFEGRIAAETVLAYVRRLAEAGVGEITLCDTIGVGTPRQTEALARACREAFPEVAFGMHFHDTRGLALANTLKAWEAGIRAFDGALGGLGGCPFAPGAPGNVATEDLVSLFSDRGVETGVSLGALLAAGAFLRETLAYAGGHPPECA